MDASIIEGDTSCNFDSVCVDEEDSGKRKRKCRNEKKENKDGDLDNLLQNALLKNLNNSNSNVQYKRRILINYFAKVWWILCEDFRPEKIS